LFVKGFGNQSILLAGRHFFVRRFQVDKYQELMAAGDMKAAIVEYVRTRDWVTFAELKSRFGEYAKGECSLGSPKNANVVYWSGISERFAEDINSLLGAGKVFLHPATLLAYLADGEVLTLPTVKRLPKGGYKKPHWLPACLRLVEL